MGLVEELLDHLPGLERVALVSDVAPIEDPAGSSDHRCNTSSDTLNPIQEPKLASQQADVTSSMTRRDFISTAAAAAFAQARRKTNFLIILADDMGYSDAGCYGGDIDTPNLNRLAAGGLRFTQAYSTARCGPSRSCLLTGQYAQQTACDVMTPGNIPDWTRFAPQHMKPLGYRSYHSGKWHIRFRPLASAGFDRSYTLLDQNRFFTPTGHLLNDERLPSPKLSDGFYATNAIADYAVKFLEEHARDHASDPFYFYLAFTSPHFPLQALPGGYRPLQGPFRRRVGRRQATPP